MKKKNLLIILFILIVALILFAIFLSNIIIKKSANKQSQSTIIEIKDDKNKINYWDAKRILNKYFQKYEFLKENKDTKDEETLKNVENTTNTLLGILDQKYIETNSITKANILNKIPNLDGGVYNINSVKAIEKNNVFGFLFKIDLVKNQKVKNEEIIVYLDKNNYTYKIEPVQSNGSINIPKEIKKNEYNTYETLSFAEKEYVRDLLKNYTFNCLNNIDEAYNKLDATYKKNKFETQEKFEKYVSENKEYFNNLYKKMNNEANSNLTKYDIEQYSIIKKENYDLYIIKDGQGKVYIIKQYSDFSYEVMLDIYTVKVEEIEQMYNNLSKEEKDVYNINTFFEMINMKDYTSAKEKISGNTNIQLYDVNIVKRVNLTKKNNYEIEIENGLNTSQTKIINLEIITNSMNDYSITIK